MKMVLLFLSFLVSQSAFSSYVFIPKPSEAESVKLVLNACQSLIEKFDQYNANPENASAGRYIEYSTAFFAADPSNPSSEKVPVFWWRRKGNPQFLPLAFIHGGVGADSSRGFTALTKILNEYPGDYVAFDHRGEGCSKRIPSNLTPKHYKIYQIPSVIADIEALRKDVFKYPKWNILGQSRGSSIVLKYLETVSELAKYPVANAFIHGAIALPSKDLYPDAYFMRQKGFYQVEQEYFKRFPQDRKKIALIKASLNETNCWLGTDALELCGPEVVELLSIYYTNVGTWENTLHAKISAMVDESDKVHMDKVNENMQAIVKFGYYQFVPYLLGTNHVELGSMPSQDQNSHGRLTRHESLRHAVLSETRPIMNVIYPALKKRGIKIPKARVAPIKYSKLMKGLKKNQSHLFYYQSQLDPIALKFGPPNKSAFTCLGELFHFINLNNSSHDGWFSEASVTDQIISRAK